MAEQATPLLQDVNDPDKVSCLLASLEEENSNPIQEVHHVISVLRNSLLALSMTLVPSFLRRSSRAASKQKQHPTAYLDGLRGVAAFFVFIHHSILDWYPVLSSGYGSSATSYYFLQLPIIRILFSGRGMVAVFFVISGYVLSHKALRLIHRGRFLAALDTLASSTFRRSMRLYLPTVVSTFISMLFSHAGWYIRDPQGHNVIPPVKGSFTAQVEDWWHHTYAMFNPFQLVDGRNLFSPVYDGHLWTIPIEFHGSMIVFITLLCVSRLSRTIRLVFLTAVVIYTLSIGQWHLFLFLSGTLLCDIHFICRPLPDVLIEQAPSSISTIQNSSRTNFLHVISSAIFLLGLWILCYPDEQAELSPGYMTMIVHTPQLYSILGLTQRFWLSVGSFVLFISVSLSLPLQSLLSSPVPQYLGKISFALYIVHGPILYTLGMKMMIPAMAFRDNELRFAAAFAGSMVIDLVVCIWAADLFWREVDARSVALAGWVQKKCWVKEE